MKFYQLKGLYLRWVSKKFTKHFIVSRVSVCAFVSGHVETRGREGVSGRPVLAGTTGNFILFYVPPQSYQGQLQSRNEMSVKTRSLNLSLVPFESRRSPLSTSFAIGVHSVTRVLGRQRDVKMLTRSENGVERSLSKHFVPSKSGFRLLALWPFNAQRLPVYPLVQDLLRGRAL